MKGNIQTVFDMIDACQSVDEVLTMKSQMAGLAKVFWKNRKIALSTKDELEKQKALTKCRYINRIFASSVPAKKNINQFRAPHGFNGIAISANAKIGKGCTIFQNVTIGSNTLPDSKNAGFPTVGENCYIGAGATIIGNVKIGNNVRIGAGCSITIDIPDNATVVQEKPKIILKDKTPVNKFISAGKFSKLIKTPAPDMQKNTFSDTHTHKGR